MRAVGRLTFGLFLLVIYCLELFWEDTIHYERNHERETDNLY